MGDVLAFSNGINADKSAYGSGVPFANVLEVITHDALNTEQIPGRITVTPKVLKRYEVKYGDVLLNRTSETQEEVGLTSVYLGDEPIVFGGFVFRGRPITDELTVSFSKYAFRSPVVRRQIVASGQGGIRSNIGQRDLKSVLVPVPPRPEQESIAEVLDDLNLLVSRLERLVAKKRDVKQGLMQDLLTASTRLPGFSDPWVVLHVAQASHLKARIGWQGLTTAEYRTSGEYRLVGGTDFKNGRVDWATTPYVDKWRFDQDLNIKVQVGDVLLTKDGTIGKVAFVHSVPGPATLNSGVFVVRPKKGAYDSGFLFHMMRSRIFADFVAGLSAGSTINHLYQRDLVTLEFRVPEELDEQRAIAELLFDADEAIDALERRLAKARAVKHGMMQELLTGQTRLPAEGAAV